MCDCESERKPGVQHAADLQHPIDMQPRKKQLQLALTGLPIRKLGQLVRSAVPSGSTEGFEKHFDLSICLCGRISRTAGHHDVEWDGVGTDCLKTACERAASLGSGLSPRDGVRGKVSKIPETAPGHPTKIVLCLGIEAEFGLLLMISFQVLAGSYLDLRLSFFPFNTIKNDREESRYLGSSLFESTENTSANATKPNLAAVDTLVAISSAIMHVIYFWRMVHDFLERSIRFNVVSPSYVQSPFNLSYTFFAFEDHPRAHGRPSRRNSTTVSKMSKEGKPSPVADSEVYFDSAAEESCLLPRYMLCSKPLVRVLPIHIVRYRVWSVGITANKIKILRSVSLIIPASYSACIVVSSSHVHNPVPFNYLHAPPTLCSLSNPDSLRIRDETSCLKRNILATTLLHITVGIANGGREVWLRNRKTNVINRHRFSLANDIYTSPPFVISYLARIFHLAADQTDSAQYSTLMSQVRELEPDLDISARKLFTNDTTLPPPRRHSKTLGQCFYWRSVILLQLWVFGDTLRPDSSYRFHFTLLSTRLLIHNVLECGSEANREAMAAAFYDMKEFTNESAKGKFRGGQSTLHLLKCYPTSMAKVTGRYNIARPFLNCEVLYTDFIVEPNLHRCLASKSSHLCLRQRKFGSCYRVKDGLLSILDFLTTNIGLRFHVPDCFYVPYLQLVACKDISRRRRLENMITKVVLHNRAARFVIGPCKLLTTRSIALHSNLYNDSISLPHNLTVYARIEGSGYHSSVAEPGTYLNVFSSGERQACEIPGSGLYSLAGFSAYARTSMEWQFGVLLSASTYFGIILQQSPVTPCSTCNFVFISVKKAINFNINRKLDHFWILERIQTRRLPENFLTSPLDRALSFPEPKHIALIFSSTSSCCCSTSQFFGIATNTKLHASQAVAFTMTRESRLSASQAASRTPVIVSISRTTETCASIASSLALYFKPSSVIVSGDRPTNTILDCKIVQYLPLSKTFSYIALSLSGRNAVWIGLSPISHLACVVLLHFPPQTEFPPSEVRVSYVFTVSLFGKVGGMVVLIEFLVVVLTDSDNVHGPSLFYKALSTFKDIDDNETNAITFSQSLQKPAIARANARANPTLAVVETLNRNLFRVVLMGLAYIANGLGSSQAIATMSRIQYHLGFHMMSLAAFGMYGGCFVVILIVCAVSESEIQVCTGLGGIAMRVMLPAILTTFPRMPNIFPESLNITTKDFISTMIHCFIFAIAANGGAENLVALTLEFGARYVPSFCPLFQNSSANLKTGAFRLIQAICTVILTGLDTPKRHQLRDEGSGLDCDKVDVRRDHLAAHDSLRVRYLRDWTQKGRVKRCDGLATGIDLASTIPEFIDVRRGSLILAIIAISQCLIELSPWGSLSRCPLASTMLITASFAIADRVGMLVLVRLSLKGFFDVVLVNTYLHSVPCPDHSVPFACFRLRERHKPFFNRVLPVFPLLIDSDVFLGPCGGFMIYNITYYLFPVLWGGLPPQNHALAEDVYPGRSRGQDTFQIPHVTCILTFEAANKVLKQCGWVPKGAETILTARKKVSYTWRVLNPQRHFRLFTRSYTEKKGKRRVDLSKIRLFAMSFELDLSNLLLQGIIKAYRKRRKPARQLQICMLKERKGNGDAGTKETGCAMLWE
ncbi:uncharacterized protein BDR25DRAFT_392309 [Lindgomyces ingoldianus]|uniref:Uncharacterized protein n=1 Tax=Lindgomyces ingoldianus TaxID=673940 RepID=A0ACB6R6K0_9PLEO|nr:uncharacterized protein BDR25DRAFT_392309 [Lindgomyces ingoldianus]KAF2473932.1 hypothetical protein BDR25DRAFT_392309 [Lindgomyces ingoldianus]